MEIEAKFRVEDDHVFTTLPVLHSLGAYILHSDGYVEQQHNTYYDTADKRLQAARYGLRLREIEGHCVATLKGPGQVRDGVHHRGEWEVETHSHDLAHWPESEARTHTMMLVGDAELLPMLSMETKRRRITAVRNHQELAELCLDEGHISAGERSLPFRELEIELLPAGTEDNLQELITLLKEHFVLVPENRSKLEQGLALIEGKT
jgi:inorganic triphosphatase YgiF